MPSTHTNCPSSTQVAPRGRQLLIGFLLATAASTGTLFAQAPAADNPVALVSRAEAKIRKSDKEDAVILLWQALDLLRGKERNAIEAATWLSARFLLQENDPLEQERRAAFALVATKQTAIAKSYRIKKWYDTAEGRLDVATMYGPDAAAKERTVLAAKRKGKNRKQAAPQPAEPAQEVNAFARELAKKVDGKWRNIEGELESSAHSGGTDESGGHWQWTTKLKHQDHVVSFEFRAADAKGDYNLGIGIGIPDDNPFNGYRLVLQHYKDSDTVLLRILSVDGQDIREVAEGSATLGKTKSGYHRLAAIISDNSIGFQIDGHPAVKGTGTGSIRGFVAVIVGMAGISSTANRFRDLTIAPLPADQPTDEELRQKAAEENQHRVTKAVEEAKVLLDARKPEPAAAKLREGLQALDKLPKGILRSNLEKSLTAMLKKADPTARKRTAAAKQCCDALRQLADKYVAAGKPRAALILAQRAWGFDASQQDSQIVAVRKAIDAWNQKQLIARASELAPPKDDGALLRQWFAGGSLLDSRGKAWIVQGPSARIQNFAQGRTMWMPKNAVLPKGTASIHVHLPAVGCQAGFLFDVAGPHDFSTAILSRDKNQVRLIVSRWAGGKWIDLAKRRILMDAWQREAWHQVTLEVAQTGVKIACYDIKVAIKRERLGLPSGRIGLYAGNYGDSEPTVEFRAFTIATK